MVFEKRDARIKDDVRRIPKPNLNSSFPESNWIGCAKQPLVSLSPLFFPCPFFFLSSSNVSRSAFHKNILDKKRSGVALPKKLCQNFSQKCFAPHFYPLATANRGMPHIVMRATTHRAQLSFNGRCELFIAKFLLVFLCFFFFNSEPIERDRYDPWNAHWLPLTRFSSCDSLPGFPSENFYHRDRMPFSASYTRCYEIKL